MVDSRTRGLELTAEYRHDFGAYGQFTVTLGGNNIFDHRPPYTPQVLRSVRNGPAYVFSTPYRDQGAYFFGRAAVSF